MSDTSNNLPLRGLDDLEAIIEKHRPKRIIVPDEKFKEIWGWMDLSQQMNLEGARYINWHGTMIRPKTEAPLSGKLDLSNNADRTSVEPVKYSRPLSGKEFSNEFT